MLGALIGDIAGSRFEFLGYKGKDFEFFTDACHPTDDSIMSLAVARALLESGPDFYKDPGLSALSERTIFCMQDIGCRYPNCGYGARFYAWLFSSDPKPYGSYGNGAAMRVGGCGFAAASLDEALFLSDAVTRVTHNHPEGMKGARATTAAIFLAREGKSKEEIRAHIVENYYGLDFTLDSIRETYRFHASCQNTVPQAIEAFLESQSFEDAIRNAISIGGDSDTLAAITGSIAQGYYGVPKKLGDEAKRYLDERLLTILDAFEARYPMGKERA